MKKHKIHLIIIISFFEIILWSCQRNNLSPTVSYDLNKYDWYIHFTLGFKNDTITCYLDGHILFDSIEMNTLGGEDTFNNIKYSKSKKLLSVNNGKTYFLDNIQLYDTIRLRIVSNSRLDTTLILDVEKYSSFYVGMNGDKTIAFGQQK